MSNKKQKKQHIGFCAVCGRECNLTLEHVPPRSLFTKPRPTPLKIYTCEKCNRESSVCDEELKVLIAAGASNYSPQGGDLKEGMWRTLDHNSRLLRKIVASGTGHPARTPDGALMTDLVQLKWDVRPLIPLFGKIARCLHFYHFGFVVPARTTEEIKVERGSTIDQILATWMTEMSVGATEQFMYGCGLANDRIDSYGSVFQYIFYQRIRVTVLFLLNE